MATTTPRPAGRATEWQLTPHNFNQVDDQTDCDGVYAKGFWEFVDGRLIVTGLRIGSGEDRIVAKFGDTITRHGKGTYTVRTATPAEMAAYLLKAGQMAEQRHTADPQDTSFAQLAAEHGDRVSTLADYPDWTAGDAS